MLVCVVVHAVVEVDESLLQHIVCDSLKMSANGTPVQVLTHYSDSVDKSDGFEMEDVEVVNENIMDVLKYFPTA